ncbi:sensor domain-containing diguanylate cyclase [Desulfocurvus vexinensis]|uniref:sensor domain-containing diguanylate cyclase n=1 Tax=Desulfocurvus vexinensis TaxID=399548 RepID=UPI0004B6B34D|nr:diguanylate cyclase [Desulfocurvus vexinensis]
MPERPEPTTLPALLADSQGWIMERLLHHAAARGLARHVSPLADTWRRAVAAVCTCLVETARHYDGQPPPPAPPGAPASGPLEALAARQAREHRGSGARLGLYLGLLKLLRQALLELLQERPLPMDAAHPGALFVHRCLDAFEIALCTEWTAPDGDEALAELHAGNRELRRQADLYLSALESLPDPLLLVDGQGRMRHLNLAAAARLGIPLAPGSLHAGDAPGRDDGQGAHCLRTRSSLRGIPLAALIPWLAAPVAAFLAGERSVLRQQIRPGDPAGSRTYTLTLARLLDIDEPVGGALVLLADVTDQAATLCPLHADAPARRRELVQMVMDHTPALIAYLDQDLRYRFANAYHGEVFRLTPEDIVGRSLRAVLGEQTSALVLPHCQRALAGWAQRFELPFTSARGETHHFDASCIPHRTAEGVAGLVLMLQDATLRRRAEQEQQRFFEVSLDMLCVAGLDGRFRKVNDAWTRILGWERNELLGLPWAAFAHPEDADAVRQTFAQLARGRNMLGQESRFRRKDGSFRWVSWNALALLDEGLVYAVAHDTTRRREMEEVLRRLATHDSLTGAANRRQFMELAGRELLRTQRYPRPVSLLMLDIDHFKRINDTHGHPAGDEVLRALVACVGGALRGTDVLGRVGGEEFAVLLPETGEDSARQIAERIRSDVERLVVRYQELELRLTISIGMATTRGSLALDNLFKLADDALYEAKRTGRNRVVAAPPEPGGAGPDPEAETD